MDAETRARHDANRADLVDAIAALKARYAREDEATAERRRVEMDRHTEGLAAHDRMMGVAPTVPETLEEEPEPVVELPSDPNATQAPVTGGA